MSSNNSIDIPNFIVGLIGTLATVVGLILADRSGKISFLVDRQKDRFSCQLQPAPDKGGEVWTIMYRKSKNVETPWLRIVTTLGGEEWPPAKRCQEIETRLEDFRKDGLISLPFRKDPNTPKQDVICVKLRRNQNNPQVCPLLITLKPGADPHQTSDDMTKGLATGESIYQGGRQKPRDIYEMPEIDLRPHLAKEDRVK